MVAGNGPLPSGVTRRPEACSSPLLNVTICSAAGAVAATSSARTASAQVFFMRVLRQCAGAGAGADAGACFCSSERRRRSAAVITAISKATKPPTYQ